MFEMQTMAIFMLIGFFVMLMIGVPVAITLATVGFVFGYLGFGPVLFNLLAGSGFWRGGRLSMASHTLVYLYGDYA
jgi:TRAP-type mannitol/chloroaromatic compound transport system permease large subunit